jgi:sugar-specific transcriptional regulator TrmB
VEKGLVTEVIIEGEKFYRVMDPKQLLVLLKDKEDAVNQLMPEMERRFQKVETKEYAHVYKGVAGFRNYLQDILKIPDGTECFYINAKLGWFDPRLKHVLPRFQKISKQKKLVHYHLFSHDVKDNPEILKFLREMGAVYKFLPKEHAAPSAIDIVGDRIFTFNLKVKKLDEDLTQFVIISKRIADSHKTWFKMIWDLLPGGKFPRRK